MKRALMVVGSVLLLAILVILLLPPLIDLGNYKARYLPLVEDALQRKMDVGELRLRILPSPAIRLSDLTILDNPSFSQGPFFTARQISLRLKFWPLLRGRFEVDEFILEKPVALLLKRPDGTFNFADLGKRKAKDGERKKAKPESERAKAAEPLRLSELIPARVRIEDAEVTLQTKGEKPLRIQGIALSIKDFSSGRSFPYRVALDLPAVKAIVLEGLVSYQESEATLSLKENHLKAQEVDFAVNGSVSNLTAVPHANLTVSNEAFETKAIFKLLSEAGVMPKGLEISGPMGLWVAARGPTNNLTTSVSADLKGLHVSDPRAFKGTVVGKIRVALPLGGKAPVPQLLQGDGKLTAQDGVLTNVDLLSKIQVLSGLIGIPEDQRRGATTFKTLESNFTLGNGIAEFTRLLLVSPLVEAWGGGKMTLTSPLLDLSVQAALSPEISARAGGARAAAFFKDEQGRIVVPLRVKGPADRPSIDLDKEKLVRKGLGQFLERGQGEFLDRFFRKR